MKQSFDAGFDSLVVRRYYMNNFKRLFLLLRCGLSIKSDERVFSASAVITNRENLGKKWLNQTEQGERD
jgi:hypothetical protein